MVLLISLVQVIQQASSIMLWRDKVIYANVTNPNKALSNSSQPKTMKLLVLVDYKHV